MRLDLATRATPDQARRAFTDFGDGRLHTWRRTLDPSTYQVRALGPDWAEARESSPGSPFWVVSRYDWSDPDVVRWVVTESSSGGGEGWVLCHPARGRRQQGPRGVDLRGGEPAAAAAGPPPPRPRPPAPPAVVDLDLRRPRCDRPGPSGRLGAAAREHGPDGTVGPRGHVHAAMLAHREPGPAASTMRDITTCWLTHNPMLRKLLPVRSEYLTGSLPHAQARPARPRRPRRPARRRRARHGLRRHVDDPAARHRHQPRRGVGHRAPRRDRHHARLGRSHWRFGNVDWKVVAAIGLPGAVGAFVGATFLSSLDTAVAAP